MVSRGETEEMVLMGEMERNGVKGETEEMALMGEIEEMVSRGETEDMVLTKRQKRWC